MAKVKGTNGDDTLVGTAGDDFIYGLLGMDSIDGGDGYDVLTINYGSVAGSVFPGNISLNDDGTLSGGVSSGEPGAVNVAAFENVERIVYTGSQDIDFITVDLGTLPIAAKRLSLDGGAGDDVLVLNAVTTGSGVALSVAADGAITSNVGTLAGWDAFDIALGATKPNTVTTGAGDDRVVSRGYRDLIDLGAGTDIWEGEYGGSYDDIRLFYSDANGARGAVGKKTFVTVKNLEQLDFTFGYGENVATLTDGAGFLFAYSGNFDRIDYRTTARALDVTLAPHVEGGLTGTISEKANPTPLNIGGFESGIIRGGVGANSFTFDGSTRAVEPNQLDFTFVGGRSAQDTLTLNLQAQFRAYVGATGDGGYFLQTGFSPGFLVWSGIETLVVRFGEGPNVVSVVTGNVTVYGGPDLDTVSFSSSSAAVTFDLGSTAGQFAAGGLLYTAFDVEGVTGSFYGDTLIDSAASNDIRAGGGDDRVYSAAASTAGADSFDGGEGTDLIDYGSAASAVTVSLAITGAQSTGGGGTDTLTGFEYLFGSKFNDELTGDDGANEIGGFDGDDLIEGLGGADSLDGGAGTNTVSYQHAAAGVFVSLATGQATGGAGSDTLTGFANIIGSASADTLKGDGGANVITGGRGADTLTGLGGADTFVFASKLDSTGSAYDSITDFSHGTGDKIDLHLIDAIESSTRFNDAFTYIGSNAFSGAAGELRIVGARGGGWFVYGDTNGDKAADLTIFVDGTTPPVPGDFVL